MGLIVDVFYLFIWALIQIGDSVLFLISALTKPASLASKNIKSIGEKPIKHTALKKNDVLFKAKRKRKENLGTLFRKIARGTRKLAGQTAGLLASSASILIYIGTISIFTFLNLVLFILKEVVYFISVPFIALYRFDKKNRETFIKEVAILEALRKQKKQRRSRPSFWFRVKIFFWGFTFAALFIFVPLVALVFLSDLPSPTNISTSYIPKTTKIYDRNGNLLYEIYANQNRTIVPLTDIPLSLQHATIAIEDRDFYTHPGFDIRGIARAFFSNLQNHNLQGGSTITQQLVKASLLTPEPTITRKVKEVILAFWAERIYSKNQILDLYFNYVPYGGTAWGVQAASEVYFGEPVNKLDLAQSAFLAGIPRAPTLYSPYSGPGDAWRKRQKDVLDAMVKVGYITPAQADKAYQEKLSFIGPNVALKAPHFVMYVKNLLVQKYGLSEVERGGLQVTTSLDLNMQNMVQNIVANEVNNDSYLGISNGAAEVLDPRNGDILAMVGSKDYFDTANDGNVNLVTSLRQPGSTIKVVTYSLALSSGFTEASLLEDTPLSIPEPGGPTYTPVDYDGGYHGIVPLRIALANSLNIPAVRVAQSLGVDNIVKQGKRMGITTWNDPQAYGLSITLGGADTTMYDLASVYGTVANSGVRVAPDPVLEIKDSEGNTIYKKTPQESQVLNPGVAFLISDILSDNKARSMEFGPNSPLYIPRHRVSVKTGTTDNKRDNWTIGYTPNIVVATWVGNNDNSPMSQALASGITGAAPMWNKIITNILTNRPEGPLLIPDDVVEKPCYGFNMYFLKGTEQNACRYTPTTPFPTKPDTALAH